MVFWLNETSFILPGGSSFFLILSSAWGRSSVSISQDVAGDANRNEENRKSEGIIAKIAKTDNFNRYYIDREQLKK